MRFSVLDLLPVLLFALFLIGARPVKPISSLNAEYLGLETGRSVRGLLAVCIVFDHLALSVDEGVLFGAFDSLGYLIVALFFFYSGYGVQVSYMRAPEKYRKKLLLRRIPTVLFPYIVFNVIYWIANAAVGKVYSFSHIISELSRGNTLVFASWFIICILAFYLIYWLLAVVFKNHFVLIAASIGILCAAYTVICIACQVSNWWYVSCFALFLGTLWASFEDKLLAVIRRFYIPLAAIFVLLLGGYYVLSGKIIAMFPGAGTELWLPAINAVVFVICALLLLLKLRVGNRIMAFLGEISFEIYMTQGLFLLLFRSDLIFIENNVLFSLVTVFGTIAVAWVIHLALSPCMKAYGKWINKRI